MRGEKGVDVGVGIRSVKNPPLVQPEQTHFYICLHIVCLVFQENAHSFF